MGKGWSLPRIFARMRRGRTKRYDLDYPAANALHYIISFNPHNNFMKKYYCSHFMREETDPERLSVLPRVTQLVVEMEVS